MKVVLRGKGEINMEAVLGAVIHQMQRLIEAKGNRHMQHDIFYDLGWELYGLCSKWEKEAGDED